MPDYSLISDSDLISLKKGDYSSISTEGLLELKRQSAPPTPTIGDMRRREEQGMVAALPPEQVQSQLQEAVDQSKEIGQRQLSAGAFMPSFTQEERQMNAENISNLTTTAARIAPALALAPLTGGMSIPAMIATGVGASAGGEAIGQTLEKMFGKRENYSLNEIVAAGASGAAPVLKGGGIVKPLLNIAMQGTGGVAAEAVRTGEFNPSAGIIPAALTGAFQIPGAVAGKFGAGFERAAERAKTIENIGEGVEPTFGQAIPRFAGLESRIESRAGKTALTDQIAKQGEQIKIAVQKLTGVESEGADTITRKILTALKANEIDDIANASRNLNDAEAILESARGKAQEQMQQRAVDEAKKSYQDIIKQTLFKGKNISAFRVIPAGEQIESLAEKAREAIRAESEKLYGPANQVEDVAAFDLFLAPAGKNSFASEAQTLLNKIPDINAGGLTEARKILSRVQIVRAPPSMNPTAPVTISVPQKASFKELQGIRDELYDFADYAGDAIGNVAQAEVRKLAKNLSITISEQAPSALNQKAADAIIAGEQFYADARPKLNLFGVRRAFAPDTMERGQLGQSLVGGVKAQGLMAPEFANIESLVNTLKSRRVPNSPDLNEVYSSIRSGIVSDATDKVNGAIDYKKLAATINNIETQSPGALTKIGFGSKNELTKFIDFLEGTGQKQGPQALLDILNTKTPAGFTLASEAVQLLPNIKDVTSVVRYLEREAVAGNNMAKEALLSTRAKAIEDLLLTETALGGIGPNLKGISNIKRSEQILGTVLYKQIVDDIIPGYKTILNSQRVAGGAGSSLVGQASEQIVSGIPVSTMKIASGKPVEGVMDVVGNALNAGFYSVISKALARSAGSAGYKSAAETAKTFQKFSNIPRASLYDALSKYADTGETPK